MKKKIALLLTVVLVISLFAACGQNDESGQVSTGQSDSNMGDGIDFAAYGLTQELLPIRPVGDFERLQNMAQEEAAAYIDEAYLSAIVQFTGDGFQTPAEISGGAASFFYATIIEQYEVFLAVLHTDDDVDEWHYKIPVELFDAGIALYFTQLPAGERDGFYNEETGAYEPSDGLGGVPPTPKTISYSFVGNEMHVQFYTYYFDAQEESVPVEEAPQFNLVLQNGEDGILRYHSLLQTQEGRH